MNKLSMLNLPNQKHINPKWSKVSFVFGLILILGSNSCGPGKTRSIPPDEILEDELCYVNFYKINNQVKIYIDDKLSFDSGPIGEQEDSEMTISLSKYLSTGSHKIKVDLINGEGIASDSYDEYWEIYYEMFLNGVPIDYIHEKNDHAEEFGIVYSFMHEINVESTNAGN